MPRIKSIKPIGKQQTYDLEVGHKDHQFYLANGALTSNSHATAYAIVSYQCAWLLHYYTDEWIASYIDYCATEKGKVTGKESPLSIALGEAKGLGYKIGKPDINKSAADYQVENKTLIPSFQALKNVGMPALREIDQFRPYEKIEDLLWNPDYSWRHSKFNKKAMSTLVKLEAFESMGLVGEHKPFKNYRQLHYVLVDKAEQIKRACSRKKDPQPPEVLQALIKEAQELEDWTIDEKISHSESLAGTVDISLILTEEIRNYLEEAGLGSVDEWQYDNQVLWCVVKHAKMARTRKANKPYLRMKVYGESGQEQNCFVWGYKPQKDPVIPNNTLIIGKFKKSDFGLSTFFASIDSLERK